MKHFTEKSTIKYNRILGKNVVLTLDLADDFLLYSTFFDCSSVSDGFSLSINN